MNCPNCGYQEQKRKRRSNNQNRYFWGQVVPIIANYTGYTDDETADLLKTMFLRDKFMVKTKDGLREMVVVKGSSTLSTAEFEAFMSKIRSWASVNLGLVVPEPNEGAINVM